MSLACPDADCVEDGHGVPECCPGEGCVCAASRACSTVVTDYHGDGTVTRWCQDHETEFTARH